MRNAWLVLNGLFLISMTAPAQSSKPIVPERLESFVQEVAHTFKVSEGLASNDVLCVTAAFGDTFAGTTAGLAQYHDGQWNPSDDVPSDPIRRLAAYGPYLYAASDRALHRVDTDGKVSRVADLPEPPTALAVGANGVYVGTVAGLFRVDVAACVPDSELNALLHDGSAVRQIAVSEDGEVVVAAAAGLFSNRDGKWERLLPSDGPASWAAQDVRGACFDTRGRLWFASPQGVGCRDGGWKLFTGRQGLPYNEFTVAAPGEDGTVWFGTPLGAIRYDGTRWAYREGRRWLPGNNVRDIAVTPEGNAWLATDAGVGLIERRSMTLAEKAAFYEAEIDKYHRRTPYGYVMAIKLDRPGDKGAWEQHDDDNDGQWTGEYGAAECFAYAATKSPEAKRRATAAFEALRFLSQVTQGGSNPAPKGFPARTILPTDGPRNPNLEPSYSVAADERRRANQDALWKVIHPRWPTSADGKWYWKCDTSSDELDGHYFLNALYFDLVAETEEEKDRVRQVVRDMTDHLVEHDFRLVDHDGQPTRWANFSPDSLNRDPEWWAARGLNSLSILSHLRVAEHVTGDPKYGSLAEQLAQDEAFAQNMMYPKLQRGPGSFVQFDDEMAFMNYYVLLLYEKNPLIRDRAILSWKSYWELEACEDNAFYNFAYAALCRDASVRTIWGKVDASPGQLALSRAVETLVRYPLNLIDWKQRNSHRTDLVPLSPLARDRGEAEGKGARIDGYVLPVDERYIKYWSDDPWEFDTGNDGTELATGMPFLLAYYMGLYHGLIVE